MPQCFIDVRLLAQRRGRIVIPPEVAWPGPFDTVRYRTALAAYPFQVRVMPSVRGRTRTGTLRLL